MGCSWSLYVCQRTAEHQLTKVSAMSGSCLAHDRSRSSLVLGCPERGIFLRHYAYVDNIGILKAQRPENKNAQKAGGEQFSSVGMLTHDGATARDCVEILGDSLHLRHHYTGTTHIRLW